MELLYVGLKSGPEALLTAEARIPFRELCARPLAGGISNLATFSALLKGVVQAYTILNDFKPDVVVATGGYASAACSLAQIVRGGKLLLHEQNILPGRTNLWLSRFAWKICVTFEDSARYFPADKTLVTGLPIRDGLLYHLPKTDSRKYLGLDPDKFTMLVLGGSQGAVSINRVIVDSLEVLASLPMQVLHQAGRRNIEEVERRCVATRWAGYHVRPYIDDIRYAYGAADIVLCRSGASTIAEITALGLPALLVPYPYAYRDHQRLNAEFLARNGAAIVIPDSALNANVLVDTLVRLINSPDELQQMSKASRKLGKPQAAKEIASLILSNVARGESFSL